jgi:hypothetical protein
MKIQSLPVVLILIIATANTALADSPLTSTYFAGNYPEYPIISYVDSTGMFTEEVAEFLLDKSIPIDAKAALVNAFSWNYDGTENAKIFREYLAKAYNTTTSSLQLSSLKAEELMCLGYFMALDNYFVVDEAINVLEMAAEKKPESFTIQILLALARAQEAMDTNFCQVWKLTSDVLNNESLKRDMKQNSIQQIVDYMILYKSEC